MNIYVRSKQVISTDVYAEAAPTPVPLYDWSPPIPPSERQYVLRMMLKRPGTAILIPPELEWVVTSVNRAMNHQAHTFGRKLPYLYLTIRHGLCTSETDDVWHVDGFSMKTPHVPEQNYIWTDCYPTEFLGQQFTIPTDFNPMRHDIQRFFQDHARPNATVWSPYAGEWVLIDPYIVHRRPTMATGQQRTMVRITCVPVEIEDDLCTRNPLMEPRVYGNQDMRLGLTRYVGAR